MTARPKLDPSHPLAATMTPADRARILEAAAKREVATIAARAVSTVLAVLAVAVIAAGVAEFARVRVQDATFDACRAAAAQLADGRDRVALIQASPECAPVVDVSRSR